MRASRKAAARLVRRYRAEDREACLAVFDGNVPDFFAASERVDFAAHLESAESFLVLENGGVVLACGGVSVLPSGWAVLDWGMVARAVQGQGLGRQLMLARLVLARGMPGLRGIRLETSQKTCGFYEGFGFRVQAVVRDGFGPGLDRVDMAVTF
jgi:GNAT superfamily N-acetyltransferase